ncbi:MAG: CDP-diacylglycerol-glycerol-3-phosphate 3-phosphatidyltransferase [Chlamydiota bacterium]|jgi:CDP-diacylglycerol--glycerol-3-phosphate 3-phosphatidyltransferase
MNIAHWFTVLRLCVSPLLPILYLGYDWLGIPFGWVPYLLLAVLLVSESSDFFDGFLARKHNLVTDLGKVLDPMADSVTHISLFLAFTQGVVQLPLLLVLIFLYRDFFVTTLRTLCALRGVALAARMSGKVKAVVQAAAALLVTVLMIPYSVGWVSLELLQDASLFIVGIAAAYTLLSVWDYFYANRIYIRRAIES